MACKVLSRAGQPSGAGNDIVLSSASYRKSRVHLTDGVMSLADVDTVNPDEKSIMMYVAQFLQYSKNAPVIRSKAQVCIIIN